MKARSLFALIGIAALFGKEWLVRSVAAPYFLWHQLPFGDVWAWLNVPAIVCRHHRQRRQRAPTERHCSLRCVRGSVVRAVFRAFVSSICTLEIIAQEVAWPWLGHNRPTCRSERPLDGTRRRRDDARNAAHFGHIAVASAPGPFDLPTTRRPCPVGRDD